MSQENVERLRAVYAEFAKGNFRAGNDLLAADVAYSPGSDGRAPLGKDAIEGHMRQFLAQWRRFWIDVEEFTDYGETVLVTERHHGVGKISGLETEATMYAVWTFRDGLVVDVLWSPDRGTALEAAGLSE
jgi:ketosteroid isomerase-like protein